MKLIPYNYRQDENGREIGFRLSGLRFSFWFGISFGGYVYPKPDFNHRAHIIANERGFHVIDMIPENRQLEHTQTTFDEMGDALQLALILNHGTTPETYGSRQ